jgi:hypothetical protein
VKLLRGRGRPSRPYDAQSILLWLDVDLFRRIDDWWHENARDQQLASRTAAIRALLEKGLKS